MGGLFDHVGTPPALVVLADHELATSTLVVRMAASTRADLYDAVLAGLGAFAGQRPLRFRARAIYSTRSAAP